MKKFVIIMLVVCLVVAGAVGFVIYKNNSKPAEDTSIEAPDETADEAEEQSFNFGLLDTDALYASHEPKEVVGSINGKELLWEDYFYNVFSQSMQIQEYFKAMSQYYGMNMDWDEPMNENGTTYAESVVKSAEHALIQFEAIRGFAKENNVVLGEDIEKAMKEQHEGDMKALCGEDADEEAFEEYLENIYMTTEMYDEMNRINHLYQQSFIQIYGRSGEKLSDESAMKFLNDGKYMHANHILLSTVNLQNGEELEESVIKEKEAKAKEISEELRAISDHDELLKRFVELKKELCDDSGKIFFPDGMTFMPGTMAQEFEDGANALEEYQVSEPVKSDFGYHIIIRLPLDPNAILQYTQNGTPVSVKGAAANIELNDRFQQYYDTLHIEYAEGFEKPELINFIK